MSKYLDAALEAGKRFFRDFHGKGKIVMLNLLKFKIIADYTNLEKVKPSGEISGKEAYQLYRDNTLPELRKAGSRMLYYGTASEFLIGPELEKWDAILLVGHESVSKFMEFASSEDYLKNAGHRSAALEDSRLLPSTAIENHT